MRTGTVTLCVALLLLVMTPIAGCGGSSGDGAPGSGAGDGAGGGAGGGTSFDEANVRLILTDMAFGSYAFYAGLPNKSPNDIEALSRWDAGVRVANLDAFERVILPDVGWTIVYAGGSQPADGMDVMLT